MMSDVNERYTSFFEKEPAVLFLLVVVRYKSIMAISLHFAKKHTCIYSKTS